MGLTLKDARAAVFVSAAIVFVVLWATGAAMDISMLILGAVLAGTGVLSAVSRVRRSVEEHTSAKRQVSPASGIPALNKAA